MTHSPETYRRLLHQRWAEMVEKNPRFSLRAFAKRLGVSPSHLSRVLNGKKSLSLETAVQISRELGIDLTGEFSDQALPTKTLNFEVFKVISDWYHFPLLELIRTKGFKSDARWIAKRMELPLPIVTAALDRLESLELIERKDGEIKLTNQNFLETLDDIPSAATRNHHEQMLSKAVESLNSEPVSKREFQSLNFNFDPEEMEEAKKAIRDFCKRFNKKYGKTSGKEVYQLNLQFFGLTRETK